MTIRKVIVKWIDGEKFGSGQLRSDGDNLFSYKLKIGRTVKRRKEFIDYSWETGMRMYVTTAGHVNEVKKYIIEKIAEDLEKFHIKISYPVSWSQKYRTTINLHNYIPQMNSDKIYLAAEPASICLKAVDLAHPDILYFLNAHAYDYLKVLEKYPKIISPEGLY